MRKARKKRDIRREVFVWEFFYGRIAGVFRDITTNQYARSNDV